MTFETLGNPEHPAVMLIHGMLCDASECSGVSIRTI